MQLRNVKIMVVGDLMLDRYWWGSVDRISPEAPVPIVKLRRTSAAAGGAANVAANIAGLGGQAVLVGSTGADAEGESLRNVLDEVANVDLRAIAVNSRPTTVKRPWVIRTAPTDHRRSAGQRLAPSGSTTVSKTVGC